MANTNNDPTNRQRKPSQTSSTKCLSQKRKLRAKDFDLISSSFHLTFKTKSGKFQTNVGGYVTLMVGMICLGTLTTTLVQYLQRRSPVVTTSIEAAPAKTEFNMYHENLWCVGSFAIGPVWLKTPARNRFSTIFWVIEDSFYNETTKKFEKKLVRRINSIPCHMLDDPAISKMVRETVDSPGFDLIVVCPDFKSSGEGSLEDFKVAQDLDTLTYRTISMKFYPCSLENPDDCAKPHEMYAMRSDFGKIDKLLKSSDYETLSSGSSTEGLLP